MLEAYPNIMIYQNNLISASPVWIFSFLIVFIEEILDNKKLHLIFYILISNFCAVWDSSSITFLFRYAPIQIVLPNCANISGSEFILIT